MYIAFEGPEGSGKGTQINLLYYYLTNRGFSVLATQEPGGTPEGAAIRHLLLENRDIKLLGITELFLFSGARAQQIRKVIRRALAEGMIVLSDRCCHSTTAYQGYGRGESLALIRRLTKIAVGNTVPDLVFLLDLQVEIGLARKRFQNEINRIDLEEMEFHQRVRQGYLTMASADPNNWVVIDATQPIETIHEQILAVVLARLQ